MNGNDRTIRRILPKHIKTIFSEGAAFLIPHVLILILLVFLTPTTADASYNYGCRIRAQLSDIEVLGHDDPDTKFVLTHVDKFSARLKINIFSSEVLPDRSPVESYCASLKNTRQQVIISIPNDHYEQMKPGIYLDLMFDGIPSIDNVDKYWSFIEIIQHE